MEDIRWKQRFSNYQKALQRLKDNIEYFSTFLAENITPADILKQGLIQSFEFTHELAWNVMKDYAVYQGNSEIKGSRDAVRYSAQVGLIDLTFEGKNLSLNLIHQIAVDLDDLLLPYFFDLSIKEKITNSDLLDHIKRVGMEFYSLKSS